MIPNWATKEWCKSVAAKYQCAEATRTPEGSSSEIIPILQDGRWKSRKTVVKLRMLMPVAKSRGKFHSQKAQKRKAPAPGSHPSRGTADNPRLWGIPARLCPSSPVKSMIKKKGKFLTTVTKPIGREKNGNTKSLKFSKRPTITLLKMCFETGEPGKTKNETHYSQHKENYEWVSLPGPLWSASLATRDEQWFPRSDWVVACHMWQDH